MSENILQQVEKLRSPILQRSLGDARHRRIKKQARGSVQIFCHYLENNIIKFGWGGLDGTFVEIPFQINTSQEVLMSAQVDKYGLGEDEWILSVKTRIAGTPTVIDQAKIYTVRTSGITVTGPNILNYDLTHYGHGFWVGGVLYPDEVATTPISGRGSYTEGIRAQYDRGDGFVIITIGGGIGLSFTEYPVYRWGLTGPLRYPISGNETIGGSISPAPNPVGTRSILARELGLTVSGNSYSHTRNSLTWNPAPRTFPSGGSGQWGLDCLDDGEGEISYSGLQTNIFLSHTESTYTTQYGWISAYAGSNATQTLTALDNFRNITTDTTAEAGEEFIYYPGLCLPYPTIANPNRKRLMPTTSYLGGGPLTSTNSVSQDYLNEQTSANGNFIAPGVFGGGILTEAINASGVRTYSGTWENPRVVFGNGINYGYDQTSVSSTNTYNPLISRILKTRKGDVTIPDSSDIYALLSRSNNRLFCFNENDDLNIYNAVSLTTFDPFENIDWEFTQYTQQGSNFTQSTVEGTSTPLNPPSENDLEYIGYFLVG